MKTRMETFLSLLLVLSLAFLLYINSLEGTTLWEDGVLVLDNRLIRDTGNLGRLFSPAFWSSYHLTTSKDYRPVSFSTFIIDNAVFGGSVQIHRGGNIILYGVTSVLLYLLVNLLSSSRKIALAAALLFASHPVHVEAVVWLKNRSELLATLFMLVALIAFIKMCLSGKMRTPLLAASLVAFILALLSKESALVLPIILCAVLFFLRREGRTGAKAAVLVPYLLSSGAFYLFKTLAIPQGRMDDALSYLPAPYSRIALAVETIGSYIRLLLLPAGLSVQHVSPAIGQAMDGGFLLSLSITFIFLIALIVSLRRRRFLALALAWVMICLLPLSNIIFMFPGRPVAEQRLFFPSVGMAMALASFLASAGGARQRRVTLAVIVICYGALTIDRNMDWSDGRKIMERALAVSPGSWKAGLNLSSRSFDEGDYAAAFRYARTSAALYPNLTRPYRHIAALYDKLGHPGKAEGYYKLALRIKPEDALAHNGLGSIYAKAGKYGLARREYSLALRHQVQPATVLANIGWTHEKCGSLEEAARYYRKAILHYPDFKNGYCDLGRVLYRMGRLDDSRRAFAEALEIDGSYSPAHRGFGEIALAEGLHEPAREHFERALDLSPGNAEVLNSIAISYKREGALRSAFAYQQRAFLSDPLNSSYFNSLLNTYRLMDDPSPKDQLGKAITAAARRCLASGHGEAARSYLETLLQIDNGNAQAREMIMELYSGSGTITYRGI